MKAESRISSPARIIVEVDETTIVVERLAAEVLIIFRHVLFFVPARMYLFFQGFEFAKTPVPFVFVLLNKAKGTQTRSKKLLNEIIIRQGHE